MKLSDADLNLMVAFEALWDERSVSRAAQRLGVGQPAMSATLARLRALLDDPLFTRVGSRMQPTPKAMRVAPSVHNALAQLRSVLTDSQPFVAAEARNVFVAASTDYTTLVLLPDLMKTLATQAPGIDLRVIGYDKDDIDELLAEQRVDLALGVFPQPPAFAVKQTLCNERFVGVARIGHPAVIDGHVSLDDFCRVPHILVSTRRDAVGFVDRWLAAAGHARRVALVLPHMLTVPAVLRESDLLAVLPERVVRGDASIGLQSFEVPIALPSWNIEMVWNSIARSCDAATWLRRCVQDVAMRLQVQNMP
jgi:DNA-binding transcriptional LysR family regulator